MTEEVISTWLIVAFGCYLAYCIARYGASIRPLTWPAVFATAFGVALACWIVNASDVRGQGALLALVAFALALVIGAQLGNRDPAIREP